jgi:hypothetical protein
MTSSSPDVAGFKAAARACSSVSTTFTSTLDCVLAAPSLTGELQGTLAEAEDEVLEAAEGEAAEAAEDGEEEGAQAGPNSSSVTLIAGAGEEAEGTAAIKVAQLDTSLIDESSLQPSCE